MDALSWLYIRGVALLAPEAPPSFVGWHTVHRINRDRRTTDFYGINGVKTTLDASLWMYGATHKQQPPHTAASAFLHAVRTSETLREKKGKRRPLERYELFALYL